MPPWTRRACTRTSLSRFDTSYAGGCRHGGIAAASLELRRRSGDPRADVGWRAPTCAICCVGRRPGMTGRASDRVIGFRRRVSAGGGAGEPRSRPTSSPRITITGPGGDTVSAGRWRPITNCRVAAIARRCTTRRRTARSRRRGNAVRRISSACATGPRACPRRRPDHGAPDCDHRPRDSNHRRRCRLGRASFVALGPCLADRRPASTRTCRPTHRAGPDACRVHASVHSRRRREWPSPCQPRDLSGSSASTWPSRGRTTSRRRAPLLGDRVRSTVAADGATQVVGRIANASRALTRFSVSAPQLRHTSAAGHSPSGVNPLAISTPLNDSPMRRRSSTCA